MRENTVAQTAQLDITTVPLRLRCPVCKQEFADLDIGCTCDKGIDIISGQELVIEYLEIE
jgi:Zn finger protein HypA/HybF involved in hydrogenase expression